MAGNEVKEKFSSYPAPVRKKLDMLRALILKVAQDNALGDVQASLKWGEPTYCVKGGSPVRFDWKDRSPEQYALYFNCNTKLVDTFRELYGDCFRFEGNRAIVFGMSDAIPKTELAHCIELALKYHKLKHLPLLGA